MTTPSFTVIVPSYNGGAYLKACVQSIQAQTFPHWALAVLDDGSTDGSLAWLQSLDEPRLMVFPAPEHLGIVRNWQRALTLPKAEWMTIVGQDDLLDPNYLAVMQRLTQECPDAGLYHAHFRFIDAPGKTIRACRPLPARETAAEYLTALFSGTRDTYGTGYLMRSARYEAAGGIPVWEKLLFADDALWITLMEGADKATAPEACFSCRPASAQCERRHGLVFVAGGAALLRAVSRGYRRPRSGVCRSVPPPCPRVFRGLGPLALDFGADTGDPAQSTCGAGSAERNCGDDAPGSPRWSACRRIGMRRWAGSAACKRGQVSTVTR